MKKTFVFVMLIAIMTVASPVSSQTIVKGHVVNERGEKKYCVTISVVDIKGKGKLSFPANFKSSYARHKVKGRMKKIPGCPMIIVKGCEVE